MGSAGKKKILKTFFIGIVLVTSLFVFTNTALEAGFTYLEGEASWYAEFSPGIRQTTANMEVFDHDKMTCAMWGIPFDSEIEVTNLSNGKKVIVRVNDRGPAKRLFKKGRVIDLTMAAFSEIEDLDKGLTKVSLRRIS